MFPPIDMDSAEHPPNASQKRLNLQGIDVVQKKSEEKFCGATSEEWSFALRNRCDKKN